MAAFGASFFLCHILLFPRIGYVSLDKRGGEELKRAGLWIIVLSVVVIVLLPWSVIKWQKGRPSYEDFQIRIRMPDGQTLRMPLEEYLVGVVAAEMPADFHPEALKAQAVAARTYAARRLSQTPLPDPGYDVDTTVQTQAWLSDSDLRQKWGLFGYWRNKGKIQKAVTETRGEVLVADGQYIEAFYHSSSGRKPTERPEDVWGSARSYLQNVISGEETPLRFVKHFVFTPKDLYQKLSLAGTPHALAAKDFQVVSRTATGRAKTVSVLGKVYTAAQVRSLLGLPSTDWEWSIKPGQLEITTYGNGHAVGMSQYGANDFAAKGKTYREILDHFYPGAKLLKLSHPAS